MIDREEFEKWYKLTEGEDNYLLEFDKELNIYLREYTHMQWLAWQARGEIDAVRIKELEAKNKVSEESELLALRNNDGLRVQIKELTAKLDKAKEALKWIDEVNAMDYEYVKVARQALEELDK